VVVLSLGMEDEILFDRVKKKKESEVHNLGKSGDMTLISLKSQ